MSSGNFHNQRLDIFEIKRKKKCCFLPNSTRFSSVPRESHRNTDKRADGENNGRHIPLDSLFTKFSMTAVRSSTRETGSALLTFNTNQTLQEKLVILITSDMTDILSIRRIDDFQMLLNLFFKFL